MLWGDERSRRRGDENAREQSGQVTQCLSPPKVSSRSPASAFESETRAVEVNVLLATAVAPLPPTRIAVTDSPPLVGCFETTCEPCSALASARSSDPSSPPHPLTVPVSPDPPCVCGGEYELKNVLQRDLIHHSPTCQPLLLPHRRIQLPELPPELKLKIVDFCVIADKEEMERRKQINDYLYEARSSPAAFQDVERYWANVQSSLPPLRPPISSVYALSRSWHAAAASQRFKVSSGVQSKRAVLLTSLSGPYTDEGPFPTAPHSPALWPALPLVHLDESIAPEDLLLLPQLPNVDEATVHRHVGRPFETGPEGGRGRRSVRGHARLANGR